MPKDPDTTCSATTQEGRSCQAPATTVIDGRPFCYRPSHQRQAFDGPWNHQPRPATPTARCPMCGSPDTEHLGFKHAGDGTTLRRYVCKACGRGFQLAVT